MSKNDDATQAYARRQRLNSANALVSRVGSCFTVDCAGQWSMSFAPALVLREGDRERLADLARLPSVPSGLAKRARMVLLAADGMPNAQIARTVGVSRPTVIGWRDRYEQGGIAALEDEPRSGRPPEIDEAEVVVATLADDGRPPERLGITHWSARFLAAELGISFAVGGADLAQVGDPAAPDRDVQVQHRPGTGGEGPRRRGAVPGPPDNAVVVSVDEKSQIQALDRTAPMLPLRPAWPPAAPMTTTATAPPPCSPPWRSPPGRSPPTPATRGTATRSSCGS